LRKTDTHFSHNVFEMDSAGWRLGMAGFRQAGRVELLPIATFVAAAKDQGS
jgi:hypothetical protein